MSEPKTTTAHSLRLSRSHERTQWLSFPLSLTLLFCALVLTHLSLLHLPYFWDEGGYYVPAALDFYRSGTLIPVFTNAHPPLPNIVLGTLWHLFGVHILVTRLTACAFAAGALTAVFVLGRRLLGVVPGLALVLLTATYPIWFAQSSLAHADIFAAAFTLAGVALYLTSPEVIGRDCESFSSKRRLAWTCTLFSLAVLSKETAVVQPAALAGLAIFHALRHRAQRSLSYAHLRWALAVALPIPVLALWYAFHYAKTGYIFGNPVFLRYNATANLTLGHLLYAMRIRSVHLSWQRNLWLPLTFAAACLLLPRPDQGNRTSTSLGLPRKVTLTIALLVVVNWFAFSVLGGALLTRYLLPVYPLLLLVCLAVWRERTVHWPWLAAFTATAFLSAIWLNPNTFFAPEDNLTYRDMVVVQQQAIAFLNRAYPDATVLTAWPVSADLTRPELGYTAHVFHVEQMEGFTAEELDKAAQTPGHYDTALVFTTHYTTPAFRHYLLTHPNSWRARHYAEDLDLTPAQIAQKLGGSVVWHANRNGEWAAVLRFHRSYDASASHPTQLGEPHIPSAEWLGGTISLP